MTIGIKSFKMLFGLTAAQYVNGNAVYERKEISQEDMKKSRAPRVQESRNKEATRRTVPIEETTSKSLVSQCDGLGYDWSDQAEEGPTNFALMAYTSLGSSSFSSSDPESRLNVVAYKVGLESVEARLDVYKKNEAIFEVDIKILKLDVMLRDNAITELRKKFEKAKKERDDLKLTLEKFENEVVDSVVNNKYKTSEGYHAIPPPYIGNFMPLKPDLVLVGEDEYVFSESVNSVKVASTSEVKTSESEPKSVSEPIIEDWVSDSENEDEIMSKSEQRKPSNARIKFVKSYKHVKSSRESVKKVEEEAKYLRKNSQSPRVLTFDQKISDFYEKKMGNPQLELQKKRVIDNGCSRHMTGNKSYLSDYEEIDGGFVAFGGNSKGGKITGKGKIRTGKLDFEDVYFVKELNFNLFSVSQMCDKKNSVLFTDTECRKHALSFMRPFGCLVTILNTLDHLGKFDGKADEGFFVGYSVNIVVGNQSNGNACTKENVDAGQVGKKDVLGKDYILLPLWTQDLLNSSNSKDSPDEQRVDYEKDANANSINSINIVGQPVNAAGIEDDVVDENIMDADMTNLDSHIPVRPIPTTRIHKDHPLSQIIGDIMTPPQTRRMTRNKTEHDFLVEVYRNKLDERGIVIRNKARLVAQGSHNKEGIKLYEIFALVVRIEAIRLFLAYASYKDFMVYQMDVKSAFLYGKIEDDVYVCQPPDFEDPYFPDRRGQIDKTLFIKKDQGDILLVQVYVDDIIFGSTKKKLCTEFEKIMHKKFQMSSMGELTFFLGLQVKQKEDGIFISQDKYVTEILKKFGFSDVKTASTPMETHKSLLKDANDIMFTVCVCARFQVNPKVSHLHAVKRIFRYLKGQPKLGLWYPKDSPFDLVAYIDSDYVGASLDRKSTTGAEYIAASNCCGQVLWIQNQLLDYGYNFMNTKIFIDNKSTICIVKNLVFHSKTKHIEIKHHFIRDSKEKKLIQMIKIHNRTIDVADLLTKAFDVSRFQYLIASIGMLNL
ncbi:putative ribonuclease H-like domain-containing protein [Tanacetum coccineum]